MERKLKKVAMIFDIDFENQIVALFDIYPLHQFSKFNNFLFVCWFLAKIFLTLYLWTLCIHNLYCHSKVPINFDENLEKDNTIWTRYIGSDSLIFSCSLTFPSREKTRHTKKMLKYFAKFQFLYDYQFCKIQKCQSDFTCKSL